MIKNIINIDNQINRIDNKIENVSFYGYMNSYEEEIKKIYIFLKNNFNEIVFKNEIDMMSNYKISFNDEIKSEKEYMLLMFSSFFIKIFTDPNFDTKNITSIVWESDEIINTILIDISKIGLWFEIYYNNNVIKKKKYIKSIKKIRLDVLKILNFLSDNNIISKKKSWYKSKSYILFFIDIQYKSYVYIELFNQKFKIYEYAPNRFYSYINHFTNIFELFKPNIFSESIINLDMSSNFISNLFNIKAKIDYDLLNKFFKYKIEKTTFNIENIEEQKKIILKELRIAIKFENRNNIVDFSKKLSEINDILRIKYILDNKNNNFFYFPALLCFRGRTYYLSSISFTSYKEFRYCLFSDNYENTTSPFHPYNIKIENELNKYTDFLNKINDYNFNNKPTNIKHSILWILISLAEINKSKIGSIVKIETFINLGIQILNKEVILKNLNEYDLLKIDSLKKILHEINNDIFIMRYVSKDATASCFQHLMKILGYSELSALKWCNLNSMDTWYDTYTYILESWKKSKNKNKLIELFVRENIKKPTMTVQYGSTFNTCWEYFIEKTDIKNLSIDDLNNLKIEFKDYYNYINDKIGLFDKSPKKIIEKMEELEYIVIMSNDSAKIDLKYLKVKKKQIKYTISKKRYTKIEQILSNEMNYKKIKTSLRANYIHTHDSSLVRYVLSIKPILTIHDCFLIDYLSITYMVSLLNEAMQIKFHDLNLNNKFNTKNIFSIFIII